MDCSISYKVDHYEVYLYKHNLKDFMIFYEEEKAIKWIRKHPDWRFELFRIEKMVFPH